MTASAVAATTMPIATFTMTDAPARIAALGLDIAIGLGWLVLAVAAGWMLLCVLAELAEPIDGRRYHPADWRRPLCWIVGHDEIGEDDTDTPDAGGCARCGAIAGD